MSRLRFALPLLFATGACASLHAIKYPPASSSPASALARGAELRVGVARVDVTPPPGVSTFGHANDAHVSYGVWSRLYCRVFVLETRAGESIALVPCDLPGISASLHHAVMDRLKQGEGVPRPQRVMLSATHTHAGPGHYFESDAYSSVASTRNPGYDENMRNFLADRIVKGIESASKKKYAATARWLHDSKAMYGISRNRSVAAYVLNASHPAFEPAPANLSPDAQLVDPRLDVLQIDAVDDADAERVLGPLGSLSFFGMHPTVLPPSRYLNADTHGVLSRALERRHQRDAATKQAECLAHGQGTCAPPTDDPLAGVFNTNEGDLSPIWAVGDIHEVIVVGEKIAQRVQALLDQPEPKPERSLVLDARYLQRSLPNAPLLHGGSRLCKVPELGSASGHGGADHKTTLDPLLPSNGDLAPDRTDSNKCHAPKKRLLGPLQNLILGRQPNRYPDNVGFGMVRLGDMWLTFVPAELTIHAAELVNARVLARLPKGADARVVGLSNAFLQYITTKAEYQLQLYEGGSTLFGPDSAEFFADQGELLARSMLGENVDKNVEEEEDHVVIDEVRLVTRSGTSRKRFPSDEGEAWVRDNPQTRKPRGTCRLREHGAPVCFLWTDAPPGTVPPLTKQAWLELVDAQTKAPIGVDDRGLDFVTRVHVREEDGYRWATVFRGTSALPNRVQIRANGPHSAAPIFSDPFANDLALRACTAAEIAQCATH